MKLICSLLALASSQLIAAGPTVARKTARAEGKADQYEATRYAEANCCILLAGSCKEVVIPVHVAKSAEGTFSTDAYDVNVLFALAARETLVTADYNISARICEPPANVTALDTVQILAHGATFNKHMWDFPYKPESHSWTKRMTEAGYTTVAVDLLGTYHAYRCLNPGVVLT